MPRPYVILNAAMTLDGKIATAAGDSKISCREDLERLHKLRAEADAVMVGVGTVLADDPTLTVRIVKGRNPTRVVVDGGARTPLKAKVLGRGAKTIVAVSGRANRKKIEKLRAAGAEVIVCGKNDVNLRELLGRLHSMGVRKLLLEGGSTLNWGMIRAGVVDEIMVAVAPFLAGGTKAKSLVGGEGFRSIGVSRRLRLLRVGRVGRDLLLVYRVEEKD
ncbi:MAG: 2,5-diamino-6-(ribosylamino)-4(3H)-pyrimidinone 5'-phosphate reductase [Candidatus Hadarchaeota archaeon]